jgi:hypothetical protein
MLAIARIEATVGWLRDQRLKLIPGIDAAANAAGRNALPCHPLSIPRDASGLKRVIRRHENILSLRLRSISQTPATAAMPNEPAPRTNRG